MVREDKVSENNLSVVSEYSLSEFLENEPDSYSVLDLKVRTVKRINYR